MSTIHTPDDGGWTIAGAVMGHVQNVLLYGPPGTGKSTFGCRHGAASWYRINCHSEMLPDDLLGGPALTVEAGATVSSWQDGIGLRSWREGKRLVLDEIDRASGAAQGALLQLLDDVDTAAYTIPTTGETVRPVPGFHCVATTNSDPDDWPDELQALKDRFTVRVLIDRPHPEAIAALPEDLRLAASESCRATGDRRASVRAWRAFAQLRHATRDEQLSAVAVFGHHRGPEIADALVIAREGGAPSTLGYDSEHDDDPYSNDPYS